MTAMEMISLVMSSGVLAGGLGLLKWGLSTERRLMALELKSGISTRRI